MNSTLSIRLDEELKQRFLTSTKAKGLDGSVLIRHFMDQFSKNPEIVKFEIEKDFFDEILKNPNINQKLEKISDKLDKI